MSAKISKYIYFYKFYIEIIDLLKAKNNNFTKEYFIKKTFESNKTFTINNRFIEILELNNSYLFGSIGKLEDPKNNPLKRFRDPNTLDISTSIKLKSEIIENFTYFLMGNKFEDIVVLNNSSAPTLDSSLAAILKKNCCELKNAWVSQYPIENLHKKLNQFKKVNKINFSCVHEKNPNIMPSIKELHNLSKQDIDKISISLNINSKVGDKKFINSLAENSYENFDTFKILGTTENDYDYLEESIDLIKKVLTKKVSINITNDTLENNQSIKNILLKELNHNIK